MVNLLMRFYELDGGEILIDGTPISQLTRENVHEQFCMVLQDTWLFEGTVRENIVYSKKNVSDEEVINACKAVGITDSSGLCQRDTIPFWTTKLTFPQVRNSLLPLPVQ